MKQFAVIGLGAFGLSVLNELLEVDVEILIIDKSEEVVSQYRNQVHAAYVADAIRQDTVRDIIPSDIDAAVIDLGDKTDVSILVSNYLKKMGVKQIIAKAETQEHGEILSLVGATHVVYPNREAAARIMPPLLSDVMFNYLPISETLVMAEISFPERLIGSSLIEAQVRRNFGLNVVAVKPGGLGEFEFVAAGYEIRENDTFLVVGAQDDVASFGTLAEESRKGANRAFRRLFGHQQRRQDEAKREKKSRVKENRGDRPRGSQSADQK
jgi:trk system potassium uptake protein TrkA